MNLKNIQLFSCIDEALLWQLICTTPRRQWLSATVPKASLRKILDICRRNTGSCKQQPNLAPIQCEHERVSFKIEIS